MVDIGNPNSVTDAGVGFHVRTVIGTFLNVKINCGDCEDTKFVQQILKKGQQLVDDSQSIRRRNYENNKFKNKIT